MERQLSRLTLVESSWNCKGPRQQNPKMLRLAAFVAAAKRDTLN